MNEGFQWSHQEEGSGSHPWLPKAKDFKKKKTTCEPPLKTPMYWSRVHQATGIYKGPRELWCGAWDANLHSRTRKKANLLAVYPRGMLLLFMLGCKQQSNGTSNNNWITLGVEFGVSQLPIQKPVPLHFPPPSLFPFCFLSSPSPCPTFSISK